MFEQAYNCIEELRSNAPKVSVSTFINPRALEAIHRALGIPFKDAPVSPSNGYHGYAVNGDDEEEGEIVDEDVADWRLLHRTNVKLSRGSIIEKQLIRLRLCIEMCIWHAKMQRLSHLCPKSISTASEKPFSSNLIKYNELKDNR